MAGKWECPECGEGLIRSDISGRAVQAGCFCDKGRRRVNAINKEIERGYNEETSRVRGLQEDDHQESTEFQPVHRDRNR